MVTIKEITKKFPDRVGRVYFQRNVTVIEIPNGRLKIMPDHRKPRNNKATRLGLK